MKNILQLSDFKAIKEHVKESKLPYREALLDYYRRLGERMGYTIREATSLIRHGINFGKLDLVWVEPSILFICEFSNMDEMMKHLLRMLELDPGLTVFLMNSKSGCKPDQVKSLVSRSGVFSSVRDKVLVLDFGDEEIL